ncbi:unnamed protein product [Rotaria sp. Silwood2]|nr:unnamed protein product [Rotaria sp. Silwood2]CAF3293005.1 unnamed protein product [Rotaria sp. Silwood2]
MQSMAGKIAAIANTNYSVVIYNGQLYAIILATTTMNWINQLEWFGTDELRQFERIVWKVDVRVSEIVGYVKKANNDQVFLAVVHNAGHMGPYDQPRAMLNLFHRFIASHKK